jgi:biopolymer transport protein ExbB
MSRLLAWVVLAVSCSSAWAQAAADSAPVTAAGPTLLERVRLGGWAMIPLGLLSVLTVGLIIYCAMLVRRRSVVTDQFLSAVDAYLKKNDYLGLVAHSSKEPEALARVVQNTMEFATRNPGAKFGMLRDIAETEGSRQSARLFQQVSYLYDLGVIAPMIGLAGTVTGMITSFTGISQTTAGAIRPQALANGVAEALIATAGGLVVGVPAMIAYAYFKGRASHLVSELEASATDVLAQLEMQHEPR